MFAAALLALAAPQGEVTTDFRPVPWQRFQSEHFDPNWCLPAPTEKEAGKLPRDLVAWFVGWTERDLALSPGAEAPAGHESVRLGDLIAELAPLRRDAQKLDAALARRARALPGLTEEEADHLGQLLRDGGLFRDGWKPDDDLRDDGILHLPGWELDDNGGRTENWRERSGDDTVHRSACLVFADLSAWLEAEMDTAEYKRHAGNRYELVEIPARSRVRTEAPDGQPMRAYVFRVRSDLPFPFGKYGGDNRVRLSLRDDGLVRNEVYQPPNDDFHWLSGRDVFIPLTTRDGDFVCLLLVQEFGFDLDGVPEGDGSRREAVRAALGNKKLFTERGWKRPEAVPPQRGRLP